MNTKPIEVRGSASVWLSSYMSERKSAAQIIEETATGKFHVADLMFGQPGAGFGGWSDPWVKIGTAEIIVTLSPPSGMAAEEIKALQAKLDAMRAQHHLAQQALLNRISKLQAITFNPEAA